MFLVESNSFVQDSFSSICFVHFLVSNEQYNPFEHDNKSGLQVSFSGNPVHFLSKQFDEKHYFYFKKIL